MERTKKRAVFSSDPEITKNTQASDISELIKKTPVQKHATVFGFFNRRYDQIDREAFVIILGFSSLFVVLFTFAAAFAVGTVKGINTLSDYLEETSPQTVQGNVVYEINKEIYKVGEEIRIEIVNNSNRSIFLVPCKYFNKFQKKAGDEWQNMDLSSCSIALNQTGDSFEKVSEKINKKISSDKLGAGIWRGVSYIYFECQKANMDSCKDSQAIYTKEFEIISDSLNSAEEKQETDKNIPPQI